MAQKVTYWSIKTKNALLKAKGVPIGFHEVKMNVGFVCSDLEKPVKQVKIVFSLIAKNRRVHP